MSMAALSIFHQDQYGISSKKYQLCMAFSIEQIGYIDKSVGNHAEIIYVISSVSSLL